MDEPADDELLADAIECVALDALDRLADAPVARSRFLRELLALLARHESEEAVEEIARTFHLLGSSSRRQSAYRGGANMLGAQPPE